MKYLQNTLLEEFGKQTIKKVEMPKYFATSLSPMMNLRPYQEECFKYFITYCENDFDTKEQKTHLLFHMATGSGKTLIMAGVMLYLYEQGYSNFLFFVDSTNIIEKTKDNFLNRASAKYLFAQSINIGNRQVEIKLVDNFQSIDDQSINLCLTTIQGLHGSLNTPKENSVTIDDFANKKVVLISDEAHHTNTATKKGRKLNEQKQNALFDDNGAELTEDWESTVMRVFHSNESNVLLEFTATEDFQDANIADKYENKVIFDYPLKRFREDGYSKDISVVQSDLSPIDRAIQCVLLSQYKRKLFSSIHQDIKPVMMLKSKTIADNKRFYDEFTDAVKRLNVEDIERIAANAKGDVRDLFSYMAEQGIDVENLLIEIKEDFKEDNLLLVDGNNISPDKQLKLNSLEAKENEYRVIFAVDMLNEGWDVLNLFDIVRLYDTRDAKDNKPGKTTIQEAQLIGRGARYMPFTDPNSDMPHNKRKYDGDVGNRLRMLEMLHYHSSYNPRYVQELRTALVNSGAMADKTKEIHIGLKEEFKKSRLYVDGYVFTNSQEDYILNSDVYSIGDHILNQLFKVRLRSGETNIKSIFGEELSDGITAPKYLSIKMRDLGVHTIRAAINRFEEYKYAHLKIAFPNLGSIKEFIESDRYLANLSIGVYGVDLPCKLSQREKLLIAIDVLRQVEPQIKKGGKGFRGSTHFTPKAFSAIFRDHTLKINLDSSVGKEYGISMKETLNKDLILDLGACDWHAYNDCFGTSEEKAMIKYIESLYPKLKEKYAEIYLVRNEKDLKLWSFETGSPFEPDYVLFLREQSNDSYDNIQIFIEPKGSHLAKTDAWKEECLRAIHERATVEFSTQSDKFDIWGLPFFNQGSCTNFEEALSEITR